MPGVDVVEGYLDFLSGGIDAQCSLKDGVQQLLHASRLDGLRLRVVRGKRRQRDVYSREQVAAQTPNLRRSGRHGPHALGHVASHAGLAEFWIREQRVLPFRIGPLERRAVLIDDVVAASTRVRGIDAGKIEQRRVGGFVGRARHGIAEGTEQRSVGAEFDGGVVVAVRDVDGRGRMAKETSHAFRGRRQRVQVQSVGGQSLGDRDRRVALDAKVTQRAAGFVLSPPVHGPKHRILGRIRVHAARPVRVLGHVAFLACGRIHQLGFRQHLGSVAPAPHGGQPNAGHHKAAEHHDDRQDS